MTTTALSFVRPAGTVAPATTSPAPRPRWGLALGIALGAGITALAYYELREEEAVRTWGAREKLARP